MPKKEQDATKVATTEPKETEAANPVPFTLERASFALTRPRYVSGGPNPDRWTRNAPSSPLTIGTTEDGALYVERALDPSETGKATARDGVTVPPLPDEQRAPTDMVDGGTVRLTLPSPIDADALALILRGANVKAQTVAQRDEETQRKARASQSKLRAAREPIIAQALGSALDPSGATMFAALKDGALAVAIDGAKIGMVPSPKLTALLSKSIDALTDERKVWAQAIADAFAPKGE